MKRQLTLLSGALVLTLGIYAQEAEHTINFVHTDQYKKVYDAMQYNAPGLAHVKEVPRFALVGKDHLFYLGIGANVKLVGDFDWGDPLADPDKFVPYNITGSEPGDGGKFQMSASQSNFYLNFVALPGTGNQLGIYIDLNFMRPDHAPDLHHAYLRYRGITAGHTLSCFTDLGAEPAAIDYSGPNAFTYVGHPNISYVGNFGKDKLWSAAIGIDMPETSITATESTKDINQRFPDIPIFLQRAWCGGNGWFRVSAIFRNLYYRNLAINKNIDKFGWGVKVSGKTPIAGGLSAMWQAVYGKGVSSYIQDLNGRGFDLMPDPANPTRLNTIKAWGAYGTLRYDINSKAYFNATYSHVRTYAPNFGNMGLNRTDDTSISWSETYKYAQYITANFFWNINKSAQFGVEYLYGRRVDFGGVQHHDNRASLMLMVSI